MSFTIMLYGATGYSGRMLAAEAFELGMSRMGSHPACRMLLAGRDGDALARLGETYDMPYRVFELDAEEEIRAALFPADVVLNAAGPFAATALPLAKAAIETGCHYVDINGEVDVYKRLDDLASYASQRGFALVSGAGHMAAASDVLLDAALREIGPKLGANRDPLGAIRIALSRIATFSRGSGETVTRSFREQVVTVRLLPSADDPDPAKRRLQLWYEPIGRLERTFDLALPATSDETTLRIASAANLVDTLTARRTLARHKLLAERIESYMESGAMYRVANQAMALFAPLASCTYLRGIARAQVSMLPDGPTPHELEQERHALVLQVEDRFRQPLVDWRYDTPNVYQLSAQLAVAVAAGVVQAKKPLRGWCTPVQALGPLDPRVSHATGPLRGCELTVRSW